MICDECGAEMKFREAEDPVTGENEMAWACDRCGETRDQDAGDGGQDETRTGKTRDDRYFVRALADGLAILESFENNFQFLPARLDEIARATGIARAKAYRMLHTLSACGMIEDLNGGEYVLHTRTLPRIAKKYEAFLDREAARLERRKKEFAGLRD